MSKFMLYAILFKFIVAAILLIIQQLKNTNKTMKDFKNFFLYLKEKSIQHEFNNKTFETYINRQLMNCDLRNKAIDCNMDIFELDNLIVIF